MAIATNRLNQAYIYSSLFQRIVRQVILQISMENMGFSMIVGEESWENGIKNIIIQGLPKLEDFNQEITINDFNPDENPIVNLEYKVELPKYLKYAIPTSQLMTAFIKPSTRAKFIAQKAILAKKTFEEYFMNENAKVITNSPGAKLSIIYDDTINIKVGSTGKIDNLNETKLKELLEKMRNKIRSFKTISNKHTKFGRTRPRFKISIAPKNIVVLFNNDVIGKINNLSSQLFHKNDVLLDVETHNIDFSLLTNENGGPVVKDADKIIGYIFDKRALVNGFSIKDLKQTVVLPKFKMLFECLSNQGFARLGCYPIIDLKTII